MSNQITVNYVPCEPAPANGYLVKYRPLGSGGALRTWPVNFFPSPAELLAGVAAAVFLTAEDIDGTQYEGFIYGDCGSGGLGVASPWATAGDSGSGSSPSASDSGGGPPPTLGNVSVQECAALDQITDMRFNGAPVTEEIGHFPVNAGELMAVSAVAGVGTLEVDVDFGGIAGAVVVTDSDGTTQCQDVVSGVVTLSFLLFTVTDGLPWSVEAICASCTG